METIRKERLERAMAEISERLRPVCADLTTDEFAKLVERMAIIEIKYSQRRTLDDLPAALRQRPEAD